ncbi:hypothetical protein [uncultured Roseibium sp.]|uniref:hypothetical protein n=1 Tax=uncultured Roseibium sp. TaxID=1936171 RepID=UPI002631CB98|nr:hypothetical protein [uncultured Roseibium sp.]
MRILKITLSGVNQAEICGKSLQAMFAEWRKGFDAATQDLIGILRIDRDRIVQNSRFAP